MQFPHEKLSVYQKALEFFGGIQRHISSWSKPHAFVDHPHDRSADTLTTRIVLNIAESNGRYASLSRQSFLDTANAAAAKMAVLLDMALRRGILEKREVEPGKELLVRIGQMRA